jgi:dihydrofolate reductase
VEFARQAGQPPELAVRRIRYLVATSLDGYIAGPNGEADWIIMDPEIDFNEIFAQFDTFLLGRRTFEPMARGHAAKRGVRTFVVSRTLRARDHPTVTILGEGWEKTVSALRQETGKDIWLFGGGMLFRSLLDVGLVDTVELAVMPVLLGGGIPALPPPAARVELQLKTHKVYKTGIVSLEYAIRRRPAEQRGQPAKTERRASAEKPSRPRRPG